MRRLFAIPIVMFLALICGACAGEGESSDPRTSPTSPRSPSSPRNQPQSGFPTMTGTWTGTLTIQLRSQVKGNASITCDETWEINQQSGGSFSGTFTVAGGNCDDSAGVTGTVASNGENVSATHQLEFGVSGCTRILGNNLMTGMLSENTLSVTSNERLRCTDPADTVDRRLTSSLHR